MILSARPARAGRPLGEEIMTDTPVDARRLLIPALAPLYEAVTPLGYSFMRAVFGIMLMIPTSGMPRIRAACQVARLRRNG